MSHTNKFQRAIATFFLLIFFPTLIPQNLYAANNGPNAPEAASFEPVDATDMVSLATGDMAYVLPLLNVPSPEGGYPVSLAYHAGIGYDQEASWIGLGWNLNPGSINRSVNGAPDDWKGAAIVDYEHFEYSGQSVGLSVSYGGGNNVYDASIGYSWDSNGTKKGSVAIGVGQKSGDTRYGASIGATYGNKSGWSGNITAGVSNSSGFGIGATADTDGFIGVGAGHSIKGVSGNLGAITSTIGISLTSNKGSVGVGLSGGGNSIFNSQSANASMNSFGFSAGFYLYGFTIAANYQKTTYERNKLDTDYVYGPLYYSDLSNYPYNKTGSDISYPDGITNTHDRDKYMDAYSQPIPQYIGNEVSYNNVFEAQKNSYNAPAYDSYQVNAQGLSGVMSPRLLDNGLIINPGINIQYQEENRGTTCAYNVCGMPYNPLACAVAANVQPEQYGVHITDKRIYVNNHFSNNPNHKFKNSFGKPNSTLNFYFDYQFPSDLKVAPSTFNQFNNASSLEDYLNSTNSAITTRKENSDYIETFTNNQIANGQTNGYFLEAKEYNRLEDNGHSPDGIGGYRITTADGKTYHYSRPVYQFEQIYREMHPKYNDAGQVIGTYTEQEGFYREVRKNKPYATHWMLTAITGPDYVKMSNNAYPDEGDYGYWVRFDYGKWTDGYIWRTPSDGYNKLSNTAISGDTYSQGRKQLVYLDKIVTRTHTALFVKSLREDDLGKAKNTGFPFLNNIFNSNNNENTHLGQKNLKLDEIILVKNEVLNNDIEPNTQHRNLTTEPNSYNGSGGSQYLLNQQLQILDKGDLAIDSETSKYAIYQKAVKIIRLNQTYDLAKKSPNSTALNKGRLTLRGVQITGQNDENFIPPYTFEYIGENTDYTNQFDKDDWGYKRNNPMLWSLNKINTPTGSSIQMDYEQDQYYTEAFSRRMFDEDNLKFRTFVANGQPVIEFQKNSFWAGGINFLDYFDQNEETYASLYCCHSPNHTASTNNGDRDWLMMPGQALTIRAVTANSIIFNVPFNTALWSQDYNSITSFDFREKGGAYCFIGDECQSENSNTAYVFNFKVMANKVPSGNGGGIRVSKISLVNDLGEKRVTEYNYNDPVKNRTSGITSYAPLKGNKYVAYRSEIPGPRVMYEYVTVSQKNTTNELLGNTQYKFNVLKPALNVFDPNMKVGEHFKATTAINILDLSKSTLGVNVKLEDNFASLGSIVSVSEFNKQGQLLNHVKNDFLTLDQLASNTVEKPGVLQESFNSMKSIYNYTKDWMSGQANIGVANWDEKCDGQESITINKRLLTSSTKITYPLVQNKRTETDGVNRQITEFKKIDPKTGLFLESHTTLANGTTIKRQTIPAYTKYPAMGSKVVNPSNKHMLTQEAMNITSIKAPSTSLWKTTSANITTWNNQWSYRDNFGTETSPTLNNEMIWRKHKNFAWKELLNTDGSYQTQLSETNTQFNWTTGTPISNNWKKLSEITRYNHFSLPVETKDINGNFASSKIADKQDKIIVSGNARYTEMYYSGAEYVESDNMFEGEVKGANFRSAEAAHTGKYSVKSNVIGDKIFEVEGSSGPSNYYNNSEISYNDTFRPGKYKISYWVLKNSNTEFCRTDETTNYGTILTVNKVAIVPSEIVSAGCWVQLNYVVDIPENNSNNTIAVEVTGGECGLGTIYCDDFRMSPLASSINSYVYDQKTDLLACTLGANNMGTAYKYDNAGRLIATYVEDVDNGKNIGGFKLINQIKQNYQSIASTAETMPAKIDNCYQIQNNLSAEITPQCIGDFNNTFNVAVTGGSGNYSYQYKWLKNVTNNTYTNYINGTNQQVIPYVPKFCHLDNPPSTASGAYAKRWDFVVKVKDLNTNFETQKAYSYEGDCQYKKYTIYDSALEISNCYNSECPEEEKTYKIHLKDIGDDTGNIKYEYAYLDATQAVNDPNLTWIDVTSTKGVFCPVFSAVADSECSSGQRKMFRIVMRVTNVSTGQAVIGHFTSVYFGDCAPESMPLVEGDPTESKYQSEKVLLEKDAEGNVIMSNRFK